MATVSDITTIPTSGLNYIDALLDSGPDWNYSTPVGNTIYYTFSVASGNEDPAEAAKNFNGAQRAFSAAQQAVVRDLLKDNGYLNKLTGIQFKETATGTDAQLHLCNADLLGSNVTGLCSWHSNYSYTGTQLQTYDVDAYVYLDNAEWYAQNQNLTPGGYGYETLLHELGHALGLKHPFDGSVHLPASQDNTNNTLMSYTSAGGPHAVYSQYDIAALKWLYGMDGLRGDLGINSTNGARYVAGTSGADTLTGTDANDTLEGDGGNDMIDGGNGLDTAVFRGPRSDYTFASLANGDLAVTSKDGIDGTDTLHSVEVLQFADMTASREDVVSAATAGKLTLVVTQNGYGFTNGNTPLVTGSADVGTTVTIYNAADNKPLGTTTADQYGLYSLKLTPFADGLNYKVYATETDATGHVLLTTDVASFNVDSTPPVIPTYTVKPDSTGSNQVHLSGTAEAGTTIQLLRSGTPLQTIAHTTVGLDGKWTLDTAPLLNGDYTVTVVSLDHAGNGTNAASRATWTVNSAANMTGTGANDVLKPDAANNAIDGGAGIDTVVYTGSRANFNVKQGDWGYTVTDNTGGIDSLINVERVHFDDGDVAIDTPSAQLYRLYSVVFGRASDADGMGYWLSRMDSGTDLRQVSREFMLGGDGTGQKEFIDMYGMNSSNEFFVNQLYHNVLGRAPDADGYHFWMTALDNDTNADKNILRSHLLVDFSDSVENVAKVVGQLDHGVDFIPHHA